MRLYATFKATLAYGSRYAGPHISSLKVMVNVLRGAPEAEAKHFCQYVGQGCLCYLPDSNELIKYPRPVPK